MWRPKPGQQKKIEWTRPHAFLVHTIKISSSSTKRPCSSPPKFLVTYEPDNSKSSVYTFQIWWCWRPKDSLLACLRATISRRRWTFYLARKRVCQNDKKLGFCGLNNRSRAKKTSSFSPNFLVMYTANRKKWSISALEILTFCSSIPWYMTAC